MRKNTLCLIASICFLFPAVSSAGNVFVGDKIGFIDEYVYRIGYELGKDQEGDLVNVVRIYFAKHKNAKGKKSASGSCIRYLSDGNKNSNDLIIKLAHTAYLEQKMVAVLCSKRHGSGDEGHVDKFVLKNF